MSEHRLVQARVDLRLSELEPLLRGGVDTELDAVAVAIAVEDAFDVVLSDADMTPQRLGSLDAIRELVLRLRGDA